MKEKKDYPLAIVATFLWLGFVCAISFMEAWLKFQAPGITLPLGLGIGKLVFNALNKIEWVFAIAIFAQMIFAKVNLLSRKMIWFYIPFIFVILQTLWLLPDLDLQANKIIQGIPVGRSNTHYYYVGMEVLKVISLTVFGIRLFK